MANLNKPARTTSDRTDVGVVSKHIRTHMAGRQGAAKDAGPAYHGGQPMSLGGKGLKTGHSATNC